MDNVIQRALHKIHYFYICISTNIFCLSIITDRAERKENLGVQGFIYQMDPQIGYTVNANEALICSILSIIFCVLALSVLVYYNAGDTNCRKKQIEFHRNC